MALASNVDVAHAAIAAASSVTQGNGASILAGYLHVKRTDTILPRNKRRYVEITSDHVVLMDKKCKFHLFHCQVDANESSNCIDLTPEQGTPVRLYTDSPAQFKKWKHMLISVANSSITLSYNVDTNIINNKTNQITIRTAKPLISSSSSSSSPTSTSSIPTHLPSYHHSNNHPHFSHFQHLHPIQQQSQHENMYALNNYLPSSASPTPSPNKDRSRQERNSEDIQNYRKARRPQQYFQQQLQQQQLQQQQQCNYDAHSQCIVNNPLQHFHSYHHNPSSANNLPPSVHPSFTSTLTSTSSSTTSSLPPTPRPPSSSSSPLPPLPPSSISSSLSTDIPSKSRYSKSHIPLSPVSSSTVTPPTPPQQTNKRERLSHQHAIGYRRYNKEVKLNKRGKSKLTDMAAHGKSPIKSELHNHSQFLNNELYHRNYSPVDDGSGSVRSHDSSHGYQQQQSRKMFRRRILSVPGVRNSIDMDFNQDPNAEALKHMDSSNPIDEKVSNDDKRHVHKGVFSRQSLDQFDHYYNNINNPSTPPSTSSSTTSYRESPYPSKAFFRGQQQQHHQKNILKPKPINMNEEGQVIIKTIQRKTSRNFKSNSNETIASELLFALSKVSHVSLIHVLDVFQEPSQVHIVMEYCNGGKLSDYIHQNSGSLNENDAKYIFLRILKAVGHLHRSGIAHWDIRPDNIMLAYNTTQTLINKLNDKRQGYSLSASCVNPKLSNFSCAKPIDPSTGQIPEEYKVFTGEQHNDEHDMDVNTNMKNNLFHTKSRHRKSIDTAVSSSLINNNRSINKFYNHLKNERFSLSSSTTSPYHQNHQKQIRNQFDQKQGLYNSFKNGQYLTPELLSSKENQYASKVDMFQLGCLFYLLLFGRTPFEAYASATSTVGRNSSGKPALSMLSEDYDYDDDDDGDDDSDDDINKNEEEEHRKRYEIEGKNINAFRKKRGADRKKWLFDEKLTGGKRISEGAKHLIMRLLCPNAKQRPTVLDCLKKEEFSFLVLNESITFSM